MSVYFFFQPKKVMSSVFPFMSAVLVSIFLLFFHFFLPSSKSSLEVSIVVKVFITHKIECSSIKLPTKRRRRRGGEGEIVRLQSSVRFLTVKGKGIQDRGNKVA